MSETAKTERVIVALLAGVILALIFSIKSCTEKADKLKFECAKTKSVDECARLIRH